MKIFIVIPSYNEEKTIGAVLKELKNTYSHIIMVNDGSTDSTLNISKKNGVITLTHIINRGLGGALGTGIQKALDLGADIIVTFDADGQHKAEDIPQLIQPIINNECDVVIGSRLIKSKGMPFVRKYYNFIGNILTYLLFSIKVTDSQSGLRAFSRRAASLLNLKANRMEVSSEIIREIKIHKLKFKEIPIQPVYTEYSLSKGQNFFVGLKTLLKLIILRISK